MNLQELLQSIHRIGQFRTNNSGQVTRYSVLFNDDGTGSVYRKLGETPASKIYEFNFISELSGKIKEILDQEAIFKLGETVLVTVDKPQSDFPAQGDTGIIMKVRLDRVLLLWFGDEESPKQTWVRNEEITKI